MIDYSDVHNEIEHIRSHMVQCGVEYKDFDPVIVAARAVAVCDSRKKLQTIIKTLKEFLIRYEQYYKPEVFNANNRAERRN
ncbi:MAG: hypothetical protein IJF84_13455 [Thermoguttaceae bacterium]|nr:hypothetical protein [Thermoguttaceae bacterium]